MFQVRLQYKIYNLPEKAAIPIDIRYAVPIWLNLRM